MNEKSIPEHIRTGQLHTTTGTVVQLNLNNKLTYFSHPPFFPFPQPPFLCSLQLNGGQSHGSCPPSLIIYDSTQANQQLVTINTTAFCSCTHTASFLKETILLQNLGHLISGLLISGLQCQRRLILVIDTRGILELASHSHLHLRQFLK